MLSLMQPSLELLPKQKWVSNSATDHCNVCCQEITSSFLRSNKHHCRYCGSVVCAPCSSQRLNHHRVCDTCHTLSSESPVCRSSDSDDEQDNIDELCPYMHTPSNRSPSSSNFALSASLASPSHSLRIDDTDMVYMAYNASPSCSSVNSTHLNNADDDSDDESNDGVPSFDINNNKSNISIDSLSPFDLSDDYHSNFTYDRNSTMLPHNYSRLSEAIMHESCNKLSQSSQSSIKHALVSGFVRRLWKSMLQFNTHSSSNQFPSHQLIHFLSTFVSISDSFDEYHTSINMIVTSLPLFHLTHYRSVQFVERTREWNSRCYHSFGQDTVSSGSRSVWKFKMSGFRGNAHPQKPCILIGLVESRKVAKLSDDDSNAAATFSDAANNGYALYTADWNVYHGDEAGRSFAKQAIAINTQDVLTVDVDLRQQYGSQDGKCGMLKFAVNGCQDVFQDGGVAFDDIDVNKTYRLAVGMYLRDKIAMYQVL